MDYELKSQAKEKTERELKEGLGKFMLSCEMALFLVRKCQKFEMERQ